MNKLNKSQDFSNSALKILNTRFIIVTFRFRIVNELEEIRKI